VFDYFRAFQRRCSSGVEQLIRNEQVVGSNPTSGSIDYQWVTGDFDLTIILVTHSTLTLFL